MAAMEVLYGGKREHLKELPSELWDACQPLSNKSRVWKLAR